MYELMLSAKDYLSQAYFIDQRISSKIEQVQSLRTLAEKVTPMLTKAPMGKTRSTHRMEDIIVKMVDMESEINADLKRLVDLKQEITTVIKCVEPLDLQAILEMRYLCYKTWAEIAVKLQYELRHVHRLHGRALTEVESIRRIG